MLTNWVFWFSPSIRITPQKWQQKIYCSLDMLSKKDGSKFHFFSCHTWFYFSFFFAHINIWFDRIHSFQSCTKNWRRWFWRDLWRSRLNYTRTSCTQSGIGAPAQTSVKNGSSCSQEIARYVFVGHKMCKKFLQKRDTDLVLHCTALYCFVLYVDRIHAIAIVFLHKLRFLLTIFFSSSSSAINRKATCMPIYWLWAKRSI